MPKSKEKKKSRRSKNEVAEGATLVSENGEENKPLRVEINTLLEDADKNSAPVIGYFPSGYDPLRNSDDSNFNVKIYKNPRNPKRPRMELVLGANGSSVNFVGTSYSGEAETHQLCNYALGILDKETGTLKMVQIAANKILRLEPKVGGLDLPEKEQLEEDKEITREERADKFRTLTVKYSTKKDLRRDVKRDAMRQTEGPAGTEENMQQKLKGVEINENALEAFGSSDTGTGRHCPPYDLDAKSPDLAYPLEKIILNGEWDYLQDILELMQTGSEVNPDVYPSFVRNRVDQLESKSEWERWKIAGILSYITHLIKYKDRHSMDGVSSAKRHKMPDILSQKFSNLFGGMEKERISTEKEKLLISYILVLTLFADDFRSNPSDIAKDLRTSPVMLRPHYEYLGCKFVRENQVLLATLPVPLEFQTIKRNRRR